MSQYDAWKTSAPTDDLPSATSDRCEVQWCREERAWEDPGGRWLCERHGSQFLRKGRVYPVRPMLAERRAWCGMRARCRNQNNTSWHNYGGRGISVCERWQTFENFIADLGPRPSPLHSLERVNNDGNYEPGNVVWATRKEQAQNTRQVRRLSFNGETLTISDWARKLGVRVHTICTRLARGWSLERALTTPRFIPNRQGYRHHNGEPPTDADLCAEHLRAEGDDAMGEERATRLAAWRDAG